MPGTILHVGAIVMCSHGGQATPTAPDARVSVGGQPITTTTAPYSIAGCAFTPPSGNGPCVTAQWTVGATRVTVYSSDVTVEAPASKWDGLEPKVVEAIQNLFGFYGDDAGWSDERLRADGVEPLPRLFEAGTEPTA